MQSLKLILSVTILSIMLPCAVQAGAWTQPKNGIQFINTFDYYHADWFFDNHGDTQKQGDYDKFEWNPYAEYGVSDALTIGINTALQHISAEQFSGGDITNWGLGDTDLFLRQRLWQQGGFVASLQPLVKLPSLYRHDRLPRSGSKFTDAELRILGGAGFTAFNRNHYIDTELAYRKRFNDPKDQIRFDTSIGIGLTEDVQLLGQAFTTWRVNSGSSAAFTESGEDDYGTVKLSLSGVYQWQDGVSFQLGGFSEVWGRNSGKGEGALFSIWKQF